MRRLASTPTIPDGLVDLAVRVRGRLRAQRRRIVPTSDGRLLASTPFGQWLYLDGADTSLTPHIAMRGRWEPGVTAVFRRIVTRGARVVEVGANIGWFTVQAAELVGPNGRVVAFEPNPRPFELLHLSVFTNGLWSRCRLERAAVAARSGTATLHVAGSFVGSGRLEPFTPGDLAWHRQEEHTVDTPVTTLDEALAPDPRVDVLKIDAEGAEPAVLDGAAEVLAANPNLRGIFEYSHTAHGPEFLDRLIELGFRVRVIDRWGRLHAPDPRLLSGLGSDLLCDRA